MNTSCCGVSSTQPDTGSCPRSGSNGKPVDWLTVAALAKGRVPARQNFWLCREPSCEVVYFDSSGTVLTAEDLQVEPGFKEGSDGLVCYCFLHHARDIEAEIADTGRTDVLELIRAEVKVGNCACEVRNPAGKCCLGDVERTINQIERRLEGAR